MTEYDYSPAAYERYIKTQSRVSNWVASQSDHTQSYRNPFVPSTYIPTKPLPEEQSSQKRVKSPPRSRSSTTSAPSSTTTPTKPARQPHVRSHTMRDAHPEQRHAPIRSMTMPAQQPAMVYPVVAGQAFVLPSPRDRHDRHDRHNSRHSSPHRSSSNKSPTKSSRHSSRHDRNHHYRSSSTSRTYTADRDSSGRRIIHLEPDSHNKVVHLPPPPLGEQYVIIPPPGGKVELVNPQGHKVEYRHERPNDRPRHHEKHQEPTFLKRIFGGFGFTGDSRNSSRSKSRSSSHRRRSSY